MADELAPRKSGRRTRDEEIALYLEEHGIDRDSLEAIAAGPKTFAEMLDLAAADIWSDFKSMKGTAKVQAFNAIRQLAKEDPEGGTDEEEEPSITDVLAGIPQLTVERRREILTAALGRLDLERQKIVEAISG